MRSNRLSLGLKFSIAVTLLIILTMTGVAVLIINHQRESLREAAAETSRAFTNNLADDAVEPLLVFDPLRLDELIHSVRDTASSVSASIVDSSGLIVAHSDRSLLGRTVTLQDHPGAARALSDGGEQVREYILADTPVREISVPIRIGGEVLGVATVAYSVRGVEAAIEERLGRLRRAIYLIAGIAVLLGIAGAFVVSNLLTRPLKRLKDSMLTVQAGSLDAEVENPRIVRCWEHLGCDRRDCPAYGKLRCWAIAGTFCHGTVQGTFAQKIGDCRQCVVYQESCGDEINELVEVFNQMLKDLRYNLGELEKVNTEKARMERLSALGEMASSVAHETKNPLNAIKVAASYLRKNFRGEILTEFLKIIEDEAMRLNEISTGFLAFSKPAPLAPRTCNVNEIVRPTVELIRQEATDRNIEIIVLTDEHIPPFSCDFSRIRQALLNLLVNAMDASREGDSVTVVTEAVNGNVRISVRDTGRGIPAEEVANIFKPFYTTKTRGSGLGLAIVDRIVKEHHGTIEVSSEVGKGTSFVIELPVHAYAKT